MTSDTPTFVNDSDTVVEPPTPTCGTAASSDSTVCGGTLCGRRFPTAVTVNIATPCPGTNALIAPPVWVTPFVQRLSIW